ncbi:hypothetical protein BDN71DRAFT_1500674 [Pleurotus eryngii]|uniref:Uncharacterized protein n=1 Tax=Pleurotus eryngii TaxID=5323 RepID=A0A9P6A7J4_PLEER|nr:hypothetical protein BDN71DRAFT_1500674 [Pleurotus eryngii]
MSNVDGDFSITPAGRTTSEPSSVTPPTTITTITKTEIRFTTLTILRVVRPTVSSVIPTTRRNQISVPSLIPTTTPSSIAPTPNTMPTTSSSTPIPGPPTNAISSGILPPSSKMAIVGVVATLMAVISLVILFILLRMRRRVQHSSDKATVVEGITPFPYSERNPRPESACSIPYPGDGAETTNPGSPTSTQAHHGSTSSEMLAIERSSASSANGYQKRAKQKRSMYKSLESMRASVSSRLQGSWPGTSDGQSLPSSFGSGISALIANLNNN